jgi:hypothetical protein
MRSLLPKHSRTRLVNHQRFFLGLEEQVKLLLKITLKYFLAEMLGKAHSTTKANRLGD